MSFREKGYRKNVLLIEKPIYEVSPYRKEDIMYLLLDEKSLYLS